MPDLPTSVPTASPRLARVPAGGRRAGMWRRLDFLPQGRLLSDAVWRRRHRGLTFLLAAHLPLLLAFAAYRGYPTSRGLLDCLPLAMAVLAAICRPLGRRARTASVALGLVIASSVLVDLSGGAVEAHFHFFVIIAFLTLYQEWMPFLVAIGFVVVEHGVVGWLAPHSVYDHPDAESNPWKWALIHGGFVLAASFGNLLAWRITEEEAGRDSMTGCASRSAFLDLVERAARGRSSLPCAVLTVDLDQFTGVNDAIGYPAGDGLLADIAARLRGQLGYDDEIGRLGGDEFGILLHGVRDVDEARHAARRFLDLLGDPFELELEVRRVSACIGLALSDDATPSGVALVRDSTIALREAKEHGPGSLAIFDGSMHARAVERDYLAAALREALAQDQLSVHYQPIVNLESGDLVGVEALVRWHHPQLGAVSPAQFIPLAERSGQILAIGKFVLEEACRQCAVWRRDYPGAAPMTVSVNLSPAQLADPSLLHTVVGALVGAGLPPKLLCLEITEGAIISDFERTLTTLEALRTIGITLSLDDFGTGYSSLSYLRRLPVNGLKIDRSFILDLEATGDLRMVSSIIELAHSFGLTVTAEGVENVDQMTAVRDAGSDLVQGFLYSRPLPPAGLDPLLTSAGPRRLVPLPRVPDAPSALRAVAGGS